MPLFMIVLISYINSLNLFSDNKMSIFKEYGAFKLTVNVKMSNELFNFWIIMVIKRIKKIYFTILFILFLEINK